MGEIVIGYDDSDCSKAALARAIELGGEPSDTLRLVYAYPSGGVGGGEVPALGGALVGSTPFKLLYKAGVPVLVVPAEAA